MADTTKAAEGVAEHASGHVTPEAAGMPQLEFSTFPNHWINRSPAHC